MDTDTDLDPDERAFVSAAEDRIRAHAERWRAAERSDIIHAVARSTGGGRYHGIPLETSLGQFDHCAERHAMTELRAAEPDEALDAILVAGAVPDADAPVTTPCGACRHVIDEFGADPTVFCTSFVREPDGWTMFPRVERHAADDLYPHSHGDPWA